MLQTVRSILLSCLILLTLAACDGGSSGSVRSARQSCRNLGGYGECQGRIGKLTGTYTIDVEDEGIGPGDQVAVEISLSVELGAVVVWVVTGEGTSPPVEATPGSPIQFAAMTQGEFDGFEFAIQALGDAAEGITYTISYQVE